MPYPVEVLVKILAAVVFGGVVGWQREARDRPAGLRTHVLVCVGSAVYTLASLSFSTPADPSRVAAQVATGMGFLGAGTIIRQGNVVRGLTTAASLWAVAAIGICVGLGGPALWVAGIATAAVLMTLSVLREAEQRLLSRGRRALVTLRLQDPHASLARVQGALDASGVRMEAARFGNLGPGGLQEMEITVRLPEGADLGAVCSVLGALEGFASMQEE